MGLFQYEQICKLNESEFTVYNYVSSHLQEVEAMSIRELSMAAGVSTTTVLRFCSKFGCDGYTEFKYRIRQLLEKRVGGGDYPSIRSAVRYLQSTIDNRELSAQIDQAAGVCLQARQVLFLGIGTSGGLGEYGARLFCNVGVAAFSITDPFYPSPQKDMEDTVLFVLSVSGETPLVVSLVDSYKKKRMKIISITNVNLCTVAKLSDLNFAYFMPFAYAYQNADQMNMTTQLPVLYLLETLSHRIHETIEKRRPDWE